MIYTPRRYEVALSTYFSGKRDDSTFLSDEFFGNSMLLPNKDLDKAYQKVDLSGAVNVIPRLKIYTTSRTCSTRTTKRRSASRRCRSPRASASS